MVSHAHVPIQQGNENYKRLSTYRSIDREIGKEDVCNGILLLSHKKKEWNDDICSNIEGSTDYYTKWSKSGKDKYIITLIYGIYLKKKKTEKDS